MHEGGASHVRARRAGPAGTEDEVEAHGLKEAAITGLSAAALIAGGGDAIAATTPGHAAATSKQAVHKIDAAHKVAAVNKNAVHKDAMWKGAAVHKDAAYKGAAISKQSADPTLKRGSARARAEPDDDRRTGAPARRVRPRRLHAGRAVCCADVDEPVGAGAARANARRLGSPLGTLARLFLAGEPLPRSLAAEALDLEAAVAAGCSRVRTSSPPRSRSTSGTGSTSPMTRRRRCVRPRRRHQQRDPHARCTDPARARSPSLDLGTGAARRRSSPRATPSMSSRRT